MARIDSEVTHGFFYRLQHCDVRYIYLFFFIVVAAFVILTEIITLKMPIGISRSVQGLYDKIEEAPPDKIVIVESDWGVNIKAESEGQMRAVLEHLMRRKVKFAVMSWVGNPEGQQNGMRIASDVAEKYGYEYGEDWVAWGAMKKASGAELASLAKDIHGAVNTDVNGMPLGDIPMMKNVRKISDVYLVFAVTYDWSWTQWLGFVQGVYGTNYAVGVSAITSSTAYAYVETGQMCGLLPGAPGAAEYEELLKRDNDKYPEEYWVLDKNRFALKKVVILSMAISYILLMILLGNISFYASRRSVA
jgi:hypothetical protein